MPIASPSSSTRRLSGEYPSQLPVRLEPAQLLGDPAGEDLGVVALDLQRVHDALQGVPVLLRSPSPRSRQRLAVFGALVLPRGALRELFHAGGQPAR